MVAQGERAHGATSVRTDEPVLAPAQGDRHAADGQIHIGDDRAVLHPGAPLAAPADERGIGLLNGDLTRRFRRA